MIRSIQAATLVGAAALALASIANADPDPAHSTVPAFIFVGGAQTNAGAPDPAIAFTVTVRNDLNNPIFGSNVEIDFLNCTDTHLCTAVIAGQTVDCSGGHKKVLATTNTSGQVTLSILGASSHIGTSPQSGGFPGAGLGCIRVRADGIELRAATAVVYDENGTRPGENGLNGADVPYCFNDLLTVGLRRRSYIGRADYSADGRISPIDMVYMQANLARAAAGVGSSAGCAGAPGGVPQPYCPN